MNSDLEHKNRPVLIRTPDHHLRVFVSSTLKELAAERKAVHQAITKLHLAPVMFESGARPHPAQDLYQAYLSQSHIFIGIYWQSYGWIAPGMQISGLEDEYDRSAGLPRLIYLKKPAPKQETALQHMIERIRDENGSSYKYFSTPAELRELVENDLILLLTEYFETARADAKDEAGLSPSPLTNLPIPRNPLIGRELEMDLACRLLLREDVALITLTGPAGTGKSRLGIQIALELRQRFADGVYMVGLEAIRDPGLVIPTIAKTLNVNEVAGELSLLELLNRHLCEKQILLLLDNFEQVLPAAPQVASLLEASPGVKILVTSRIPLHLRAEKELVIPPLKVPPLKDLPELQPLSQFSAVQLFIQRCQAVRADFSVTNENAPAIAETCIRLDGLPLAIELAAARIKILTPQQLLARLDKRFEVLRGGTKDLPERQQTMYSAIDWSYELLNERDKRLFLRLSVFSGGWIVDAAIQVCGKEGQGEAEILDALEMLVDNNLLQAPQEGQGEPRLRMLESIREFAYDRLKESGESEAIHQRHAQYYAALAERAEAEKFGTQQQLAWRIRLEEELDNMRAAMSWALENGRYACELRIATGLWRFWWTHGRLREGVGWLQQGLASLAPGEDEVRAKALTRLGWMVNKIGDPLNSLEILQQAVELWRQINNPAGLAQALSNLGGIMLPHDTSQATTLLEEALQIRREINDRRGTHATLMNLGLAMFWQGNIPRMIDLFKESLAMSKEVKDDYSTGVTLINLGDAYANLGEYQQAEDYFAEAEQVYQLMDDKVGLSEVSRGRGNIALKMGDPDLALKLFSDALQSSFDTGVLSITLVTLEGIAFTAQKMNDPFKAARLLSACDTIRAKMKLRRIGYHQADCDDYLATIRSLLDSAQFASAWDEGSRLSIDDAVAYAIEPSA